MEKHGLKEMRLLEIGRGSKYMALCGDPLWRSPWTCRKNRLRNE